VFRTLIFLKENVDREQVKKLCESIAGKDSSFVWRISDNYLIIESLDKNKAVKRGLLFVKKYLKEYNLGFEVSSPQ
jgi:hypothetical protein